MAGVRGRENVLRDGDMDGGIWTTGQSQALIHDIPTCDRAGEEHYETIRGSPRPRLQDVGPAPRQTVRRPGPAPGRFLLEHAGARQGRQEPDGKHTSRLFPVDLGPSQPYYPALYPVR
jgi:hypothetical protein